MEPGWKKSSYLEASFDEKAIIYTTIGERSSKCEEFLAVRSQFDSDHGVDFSAPTCCQSATFVRALFALYCPLFFTKNNNK